MFLLYPFAAMLSAFFALLTWVLAPLLALTVCDGYLPKYLYWFQTFDNSFVSGPLSMGWVPGYVSSVRWLWRNPSYGFDMFLLGIKFDKSEWTVMRDEPNCFFAYSRYGAFSYRGAWFKFGWKAWAGLSGIPNQAWLKYGRVPVVVVR